MVVNPEEVEVRQEVVVSGRTYEAGAALRQSSLWRDAVRRFSHNRAALIAMIAFVILVAYVVIAPLVVPYDPNEVDFSIAYHAPSLSHPFAGFRSQSRKPALHCAMTQPPLAQPAIAFGRVHTRPH